MKRLIHCTLCTLVAALTLLAGTAGCDDYPDYVEISAVTSAPPSRNAGIRNRDKEHWVRLSKGVALGFRCYDTCDGVCIAPEFQIADPSSTLR